MATSFPTYDPKTTAAQLAQIYTQGRQSMLDAQASSATAIDKALAKLGTAMGTFRSALSAMSTTGSVVANKATFSSDVGTATATATASAGNYQFYVEQLATVGQVSFNGVSDAPAAGAGTLAVKLADGSSFTVSLANGDKDLNNALSAKEIAAAINLEASNNSRVTASTLTVNGQTRLVLTSNLSGQANGVVGIDTSGLGDPTLASQLGAGNTTVMQSGTDAIVWIGAQGGDPSNKITQASNTFTVVDGVSMTFTKAQAPGATPVSLNVARDSGATGTNVQNFVDQWNKMLASLGELTAAGDAAKGTAAGIYASDAGIAALKTRMQSLLRTSVGGVNLVNYGITAQRDGTLSLDKTRLDKSLAINPAGLDAILGKASSVSPSGVLGSLDTLMGSWTKSGSGQIATRKDANARLQTQLAARQAVLETQYDNAYKRYLAQFTQLQSLQSQMSGTSSMFEAMFSKSDS
jgi:flagellar hook-associated protein 2